jgi:hypothetical protein
LISFLALLCNYDRENCLINLGTEGPSHAGPSFTGWAILAFYGGAVIVIGLVILAALVLFGAQ